MTCKFAALLLCLAPFSGHAQTAIADPTPRMQQIIDSNAAILPQRAEGYSPSPKGIVHAGYISMTIPFSAGALYSTTGDLLKWEQGLVGGKVLKPESLAA